MYVDITLRYAKVLKFFKWDIKAIDSIILYETKIIKMFFWIYEKEVFFNI